MDTIIIEIRPDGEAIVEVKGVKGPLCMKKSGWLEKILGTVKKRSYKKEYHDHAYNLIKSG
jgi:hypothetical protein